MRTEEEVRAKLVDRKEQLKRAYSQADILAMNVIGNQASILEWVLGAEIGPEAKEI